MDLQRINVKFYLEDQEAISSEEAFRVFNNWIPNTPDEMLVDVADYSHLPNSQQTLLVGHEASYSIDTTDGRKGLLYSRSRPANGSHADRLRDAFRKAASACARLEQDAEGEVVFDGSEALLIVNDRLNAPNTDETMAAIRDDLESVLKDLYGDAHTDIERDTDPKSRFAVRIRASGDFDVATLIENLG